MSLEYDKSLWNSGIDHENHLLAEGYSLGLEEWKNKRSLWLTLGQTKLVAETERK